MTKPKYPTAAARKAAASEQAQKQMRAQWERQREESGQQLGYFGCHRRVRKERGRAADQKCTRCGKQARHWAHIHRTDPAGPENYVPLCQSCHWLYDDVGARVAEVKGADRRSAAATLAWRRRSFEERQAIIQKSWATRRKNAGVPDDLPPSSLAGD